MKYKLLKDLPGCKAGVVSETEGLKIKFGGLWFTPDVIMGSPDFFEEVPEVWALTWDWVIIDADVVNPSETRTERFSSREEAEKYKRWHEPRFSLQDVEDAVLKNSANVNDEIEKLKG